MKKRLLWLTVPIALTWSALAGAAPTKSFTAAQGVLPSDVEILGSSNVKTVRATQLFTKFFPELLKIEKEIPEGLDKVKKTCGIDAVTAIDDVTVGVDRKQEGAIFLGLAGVTEQKFLDCMSKIAKGEGETLTSKKTGNIIELKTDKGKKTLYIAWLAGDVLVFASEPDDKALLERMINGKGGLAKNTKMSARLAKANKDAALMVVWTKEAPIEKMTMKGGDLAVTYAGGTINAQTTLEMASSKEADQMAAGTKMIATILGVPKDAPKELEKLLKSLDAKTNGSEVTVKAQAAESDLITILKWAMQTGGKSSSKSGGSGAKKP